MAPFPFPGLTDLRDRYLYNITPWAQTVSSAARRGLRLFYSDEEDDDVGGDDEQRIAVAAAFGVAAVFRSPRRRDSAARGPSPSSSFVNAVTSQHQGPADRDRINLDISALKKQYAKLRERQKQAHIILTAACARQPGPHRVPAPPVAVNHLLLGKKALMSRGGRKGPPPGVVPPALPRPPKHEQKPVQPNQPLPKQNGGQTLHWRDAKPSPPVSASEVKDEDTDDDGSSTSTELCDEEPGRLSDFDSEEPSISDTSPLPPMSNQFLPEDDLFVQAANQEVPRTEQQKQSATPMLDIPSAEYKTEDSVSHAPISPMCPDLIPLDQLLGLYQTLQRPTSSLITFSDDDSSQDVSPSVLEVEKEICVVDNAQELEQTSPNSNSKNIKGDEIESLHIPSVVSVCADENVSKTLHDRESPTQIYLKSSLSETSPTSGIDDKLLESILENHQKYISDKMDYSSTTTSSFEDMSAIFDSLILAESASDLSTKTLVPQADDDSSNQVSPSPSISPTSSLTNFGQSKIYVSENGGKQKTAKILPVKEILVVSAEEKSALPPSTNIDDLSKVKQDTFQFEYSATFGVSVCYDEDRDEIISPRTNETSPTTKSITEVTDESVSDFNKPDFSSFSISQSESDLDISTYDSISAKYTLPNLESHTTVLESLTTPILDSNFKTQFTEEKDNMDKEHQLPERKPPLDLTPATEPLNKPLPVVKLAITPTDDNYNADLESSPDSALEFKMPSSIKKDWHSSLPEIDSLLEISPECVKIPEKSSFHKFLSPEIVIENVDLLDTITVEDKPTKRSSNEETLFVSRTEIMLQNTKDNNALTASSEKKKASFAATLEHFEDSSSSLSLSPVSAPITSPQNMNTLGEITPDEKARRVSFVDSDSDVSPQDDLNASAAKVFEDSSREYVGSSKMQCSLSVPSKLKEIKVNGYISSAANDSDNVDNSAEENLGKSLTELSFNPIYTFDEAASKPENTARSQESESGKVTDPRELYRERGRRNSERALQIIKENSEILQRILKQNKGRVLEHTSETSESSSSNSASSPEATNPRKMSGFTTDFSSVAQFSSDNRCVDVRDIGDCTKDSSDKTIDKANITLPSSDSKCVRSISKKPSRSSLSRSTRRHTSPISPSFFASSFHSSSNTSTSKSSTVDKVQSQEDVLPKLTSKELETSKTVKINTSTNMREHSSASRPITFNPFPVKSVLRPPKDITIKLGLYSPTNGSKDNAKLPSFGKPTNSAGVK